MHHEQRDGNEDGDKDNEEQHEQQEDTPAPSTSGTPDNSTEEDISTPSSSGAAAEGTSKQVNRPTNKGKSGWTQNIVKKKHKYACEKKCGKSFAKFTAYQRHKSICAGVGQVYCERCPDRKIIKITSLKSHLSRMHPFATKN